MNNSTRMMLVKNRQMHEESNKDSSNYGVANERKIPAFDRDTAELWVSEMESRDGTKGGKWTYDQTTQLMKQKGFDCDPVSFFAAMNLIYSDYGKTLAKYGITAPDAFAELAYDWVKDADSVGKEKAQLYYRYIVK